MEIIGNEISSDKIIEWNIDNLKKRSELGIKKYSTTLCSNKQDNFLTHLYEELLDAVNYIPAFIYAAKELAKEQDDAILAKEFRRIYG